MDGNHDRLNTWWDYHHPPWFKAIIPGSDSTPDPDYRVTKLPAPLHFIVLSLLANPVIADNTPDQWYRLGIQAEHGEGVPMDKQQAFRHYCEAARGGHAGALHNLGWMYLNGRGVNTNEAKAGYWLKLAAAAGDQHSIRLLSRLVLASTGKDDNCLLAEPEPQPVARTERPARNVKAKLRARCNRIGPVGSAEQQAEILDWLISQSLQAAAKTYDHALGPVYQVYRDPLGSEADARRAIAAYREQGITDLHLITQGSARFGVSLGAYRIQANAERRIEQLARMGIEAAYRPQDPVHQQTWVEFRALPRQIVQLHERFPVLITEPAECADLPSSRG